MGRNAAGLGTAGGPPCPGSPWACHSWRAAPRVSSACAPSVMLKRKKKGPIHTIRQTENKKHSNFPIKPQSQSLLSKTVLMEAKADTDKGTGLTSEPEKTWEPQHSHTESPGREWGCKTTSGLANSLLTTLTSACSFVFCETLAEVGWGGRQGVSSSCLFVFYFVLIPSHTCPAPYKLSPLSGSLLSTSRAIAWSGPQRLGSTHCLSFPVAHTYSA